MVNCLKNTTQRDFFSDILTRLDERQAQDPQSWSKKGNQAKFVLGEFRRALADIQKLPACAAGEHKPGWDSNRTQIGCTSCHTWVPQRPNVGGDLLYKFTAFPEFTDHINSMRESLFRKITDQWVSAEDYRPVITEMFLATCGEECQDDHPFWTLLNEMRPDSDRFWAINGECATGTHKHIVVFAESEGDEQTLRCGNCEWPLLSLTPADSVAMVPPEERLGNIILNNLHTIAKCVAKITQWGGHLSPVMGDQFQRFISTVTEADQQAILNRVLAEYNQTLPDTADPIRGEIGALSDVCPTGPADEWAGPFEEVMQALQTHGKRVARTDLLKIALEMTRSFQEDSSPAMVPLDDAWETLSRENNEQNRELLLRREELERQWIKPEHAT